MSRYIYHVVRPEEWAAGSDPYSPGDYQTEGFIHCSFAHQVAGVVQRYYGGARDVGILEIDPFKTEAVIRIEPAAGGERTPTGELEEFPHLFGPIPRSAVARVGSVEEFEPFKRIVDGFVITDDASRFDLNKAYRYLSEQSYWAKGEPRAVFDRSVDHSWNLFLHAPSGESAGMARVITDWATAYYVCDLFVFQEFRGRGLGKALIQSIVEHPTLAPLHGMLLTADAHGMYRQYGFEQDDEGMRRFMRRKRATNPEPVVE